MTLPPIRDPDSDAAPGLAARARDALHRAEQAVELTVASDIEEARAIAPLVEEAEAVPLQLRGRLRRWLPLLALLTLGATLILSGAYDLLNMETLARHYDRLHAWVDARPVVSAIVLVLSLSTMMSTGLPGSIVFVLSAGLFYGTFIGGLLAICGNTLGASVLFLAARRFFGSGRKPPALVDKIRDGFQRNPASFAFFIRVIPIFPFGAASVALAWLGCRFPLFVTSSFLGGLPGTWIYCSLGAGLAATIRERQDVKLSILAQPRFAIPLLLIAVLALIPVLLGIRRKRAARHTGEPS